MSLPDIRIGFSEPLYQFSEPEAANITANLILVKNRQSEQTFLVTVMLNNTQMLRPATLSDETAFDYRVNNGTTMFTSSRTLQLNFPPNIQNLTFSLTLNSDEEVEGVEGFEATISPSDAFMRPVVGQAYQSTIVQILDGDCKLQLISLIIRQSKNPDLLRVWPEQHIYCLLLQCLLP